MPHTRLPTKYGPRPDAGPPADTLFEKIALTTKTSTNVPMISLTKFANVFRIAGAVQNTPSFALTSGVSFQCGKYCTQTNAAPRIAPSNCALKYGRNFPYFPARTANPSVTAGFRCASLLPQAIAVNTPHITANAHPAVITIHPLFSAFDFLSSTAATTPSPSRIKISVPRNSPSHGDVMPILSFSSQPNQKNASPLFSTRHKAFRVALLQATVSMFDLPANSLAIRQFP